MLRNHYIIGVLVLIFLSAGTVQAQEKQHYPSESEIVMTKAQLDSLLSMIAKRKREVLARKAESQYPSKARYAAQEEVHKPQEKAVTNSRVIDRIYQQFDRLNRRMDWLILNMNNSQPAIYVTPQSDGSSPSVIYMNPNSGNTPQVVRPGIQPQLYRYKMRMANQQQPTKVEQEEAPVATEPVQTTAVDSTTLNSIKKLKSKIASMNEKMRVLDTLATITSNQKYNQKISALKSEIGQLKNKLDDEQAALKQKDAAHAELKAYKKVIYFANNSTALGQTEKVALANLVEKLKQNDARVTVVLHGFASKSGNALYNNKISFERAEAIKEVLVQNGLAARQITIMPHGTDSSASAQQARRVEIDLVVY